MDNRFWFWDFLIRDDYDIGVEAIITHPHYHPKIRHRFDIAILRLSSPIDFGHKHIGVRCVCQPEPLDRLNLSACITMGFGSTVPVHNNRKASKSTRLLEINIPVLSDSKCMRLSSSYNPHWHVCAMTANGGKDSCKGDSGGPLICPLLRDDGTTPTVYSLVGLTSFGSEHCGGPGFAGYYTRVNVMLYWIQANTLNDDD